MSLSDWEDLISEDDEDDFETPKVSANAPPAPWKKRIIILLDVDCFEVQLWAKIKRPEVVLQDVPVVVINLQNIILSVNYTAKSLGVKRGEGLTVARTLCKEADIKLIEIKAGELFGKVDSFRPQIESDLILDAILEYAEMQKRDVDSPAIPIKVERNCRDEFYIDATQFVDECNTTYYKNADPFVTPTLSPEPTNALNRLKKHPNEKYNSKPTTIMEGREGKITGQDLNRRVLEKYPYGLKAHHADELRLVQGAIHANSLIRHIKKRTRYEVSAGVGHSKLVAKLACGRNKPKGITIMTEVSLPRLSKNIPFQDLPGYGSQTGKRIQNLLFSDRKQDVNSIEDLLRVINGDHKNLVPIFKKLNISGPEWKSMQLLNLCKFKDDSQVIRRVYSGTFGTSLSFKGLMGKSDSFQNGVKNLSMDMIRRIEYYKKKGRHPKELCIKAEMIQNSRVSPGDRANKISIPEDTFTDLDLGKKIIGYINQNKLIRNEILKIKLTASKISVIKPRPNEEYDCMSEVNFPIDAEQGRTGYKIFQEIPQEPPVSCTSHTRELRAPRLKVCHLIAQPVKCNCPDPKISQSAPDAQDGENNVGFTMEDFLVLVLIILFLAIQITFAVFYFSGSKSFFMLNDD